VTVLRSGSATDVGRVRSINEDRALEGDTLFAVADGMGGHAGGEVAAGTAIDHLERGFAHEPSVEGLVDAVHEANHAVWEQGRSDPALRGMGTTLVAAALIPSENGDRLVLANVGDSRAYRLHRGVLHQLTKDHSVAEELVARGELSEEEAAVHPHRHILTRALGVNTDVEVDTFEFVPEQGDRYLLCSDGLSNEVPAEEIEEVLSDTRDPKKAAEILVRVANESGGNDNITAVVLDVLVGEAPAETDDEEASDAVVPLAVASGSAGFAPARTAGTPEGAVSSGSRDAALMGRSEEAGGEDAIPLPATRIAAPPRRRTSRRLTFRVLLFVVVLGALGYGAYAAVRWYVNNSYYVGLRHGEVVVFQGRRGGFLGIDPKVVELTAITGAEVPSYIASSLSSGVEEPSFHAAKSYVSNLKQQLCAEQTPPAGLKCLPSSSGTTTTTLPPSSSTTGAVLPTISLRRAA